MRAPWQVRRGAADRPRHLRPPARRASAAGLTMPVCRSPRVANRTAATGAGSGDGCATVRWTGAGDGAGRHRLCDGEVERRRGRSRAAAAVRRRGRAAPGTEQGDGEVERRRGRNRAAARVHDEVAPGPRRSRWCGGEAALGEVTRGRQRPPSLRPTTSRVRPPPSPSDLNQFGAPRPGSGYGKRPTFAVRYIIAKLKELLC
ncbi:hypothetical protein ACQJBY_034721 [Aegilops geniculata]